ncbi:DUF1223 domain-containing protein [Poseidonocella sedimentorum]|uniref:DUF1223 domain-containing protein n=1 Tax=Poseidonocella sedimentorum TaxID=871652 RepID=A0A1I6CRG7_9RHOB|nr:DUF1223 domain-containing protein [Poseidonocella sedimentorum]SFQ95677.1 hypothetical protein SAMN04515673_101234 [Poseidonocella sedimentorum]
MGPRKYGRISGLATLLAALLITLQAGRLRAEDSPVVVELFTSQGCSSCPSADALMPELAAREDLIALSLHVDYWDYLGWPDQFAGPQFTARQKRYAKAMGERMVYTPQMVIGGAEHVVGNHGMKVANAIARQKAISHGVTLKAHRSGGMLELQATARRPFKRLAQVIVMPYLTEASVQIGRGENAGRTVRYVNIVRDIHEIGKWDGRNALSLRVPVPGELPFVVVIQAGHHGPILGAAELR